MALTTSDDILAAIGAGRTYPATWSKVTGAATYSANRWYAMQGLSGNPVGTSWPGTAKTFVQTTLSNGDGTVKFGIPHGGTVSTYLQYIINMTALATVATGVPATLRMVDLIGYWNGIDMNSNALQSLSGTPTIRTIDGYNRARFCLVANATTGATAHNLAYTYVNQAGTGSKTNPFTVACTASAIVPHLVHTGGAANNFGPDLPLASGDTGVNNVSSVQLSAASGTASTAHDHSQNIVR